MNTTAWPIRNESTTDEQNPFHDFGLLPGNVAPSTDTIRASVGVGHVVAKYVAVSLMVAVGLGLTAWFASTTPAPLNVIGTFACLTGLAALWSLGTRNEYRWIELDGTMLRARRLFTGSTIERSVDEIASLVTLYHGGDSVETRAFNKLYGRVQGVAIRFRDQTTTLRVSRMDPHMDNAQELLEAVMYRMTQVGPLEANIVDIDGRPLVRSVRWRGEPLVAAWKYADALWGLALLAVLLLGVTLCFWHMQLQQRVEISSLPPHRVPLAELLQLGPGENRHVTITDFELGGFAHGDRRKSWSKAWVALIPNGRPTREIEAVLSCESAHDEADLKQRLQSGMVTGLCSQTSQSSWSTTFRRNLVAANNNLPLNSAWLISEMHRPPRAELVEGIRIAAIALLALAILVSFGFLSRGVLSAR